MSSLTSRRNTRMACCDMSQRRCLLQLLGFGENQEGQWYAKTRLGPFLLQEKTFS